MLLALKGCDTSMIQAYEFKPDTDTIAYLKTSDDAEMLTLTGRPIIGSSGIAMTDSYLKGWYTPPNKKIHVSEKTNANGSYPVQPESFVYAERVVTVNMFAYGGSRSEVVHKIDEVSNFLNRDVIFQVIDGGVSTYIEGYATITWDEKRYQDTCYGTLTVVTNGFPFRRSSKVQKNTFVLTQDTSSKPGLRFKSTNLLFPLQYGASNKSNKTFFVKNDGNITAYPEITITGDDIKTVKLKNSESTFFVNSNFWGTLVINPNEMPGISINKLDASVHVLQQTFPLVPPSKSSNFTIEVQSSSKVFIKVIAHDIYL